jgi:hypothetical protein
MGGARKLLRGHYNPVNWTRKYPNLQWAQVPVKSASGSEKKAIRKLICTRCIKSLNKKVEPKISL